MNTIDEYSLDNLDMYSTYGWITESGGRDLIRLPKVKERISQSFPDANGTEYDLSAPFVEERNTTLTGVIIADTIDQFFAFQDAFLAAWLTAGTKRLYKKSYNRSFYVIYKDCTQVTDIVKFKEYGNKIGMRYSLAICEPIPNFNRPFNLLVDENNDYFTDGDGNRILMDIQAA